MRLPEFDWLEPDSVQAVCAALAEDPEGSAVYAGGTDVLVNLKEGLAAPRRLVSIRRIAELKRISYDETEGLSIGAMATVNEVARDARVAQRYPGIVDAALSLAADQVRNMATVGGNLCHGIPSADMAPILVAHDARMRLVSSAGERVVPLREFFTGPRATVRRGDELLVCMEVPLAPATSGDASLRQGGRASLSLPMAVVAALVRLDGARCSHAAVALGAVAPTPILVPAVGDLLAGKTLDESLIAEAGELAAQAARPIDDFRASKGFRLELVRVFTRRTLTAAAARALGEGA